MAEPIREIMAGVIRGLVSQKKRASGSDPQAWLKKTLTGKELRHIKFHYFKKGTLAVNVDSSIWLYQLSLKKEDLLEKLRKQSAAVKDIRFRLGEIK